MILFLLILSLSRSNFLFLYYLRVYSYLRCVLLIVLKVSTSGRTLRILVSLLLLCFRIPFRFIVVPSWCLRCRECGFATLGDRTVSSIRCSSSRRFGFGSVVVSVPSFRFVWVVFVSSSSFRFVSCCVSGRGVWDRTVATSLSVVPFRSFEILSVPSCHFGSVVFAWFRFVLFHFVPFALCVILDSSFSSSFCLRDVLPGIAPLGDLTPSSWFSFDCFVLLFQFGSFVPFYSWFGSVCVDAPAVAVYETVRLPRLYSLYRSFVPFISVRFLCSVLFLLVSHHQLSFVSSFRFRCFGSVVTFRDPFMLFLVLVHPVGFLFLFLVAGNLCYFCSHPGPLFGEKNYNYCLMNCVQSAAGIIFSNCHGTVICYIWCAAYCASALPGCCSYRSAFRYFLFILFFWRYLFVWYRVDCMTFHATLRTYYLKVIVWWQLERFTIIQFEVLSNLISWIWHYKQNKKTRSNVISNKTGRQN